MDEKRPVAPERPQQERAEEYWLILDYADLGPIRLDSRVLDRILAVGDQLVLVVDEKTVKLPMQGGAAVAASIVERLEPFVRRGPLVRREAYEDALRRLELVSRGRRENGSFVLFIDTEDVFATDKGLFFGDSYIAPIEEVGAQSRPSSPSSPGLHAIEKLLVLVVASKRREEDMTALAQKVAQYESEHPSS